jgi:hypothetical protein
VTKEVPRAALRRLPGPVAGGPAAVVRPAAVRFVSAVYGRKAVRARPTEQSLCLGQTANTLHAVSCRHTVEIVPVFKIRALAAYRLLGPHSLAVSVQVVKAVVA